MKMFFALVCQVLLKVSTLETLVLWVKVMAPKPLDFLAAGSFTTTTLGTSPRLSGVMVCQEARVVLQERWRTAVRWAGGW